MRGSQFSRVEDIAWTPDQNITMPRHIKECIIKEVSDPVSVDEIKERYFVGLPPQSLSRKEVHREATTADMFVKLGIHIHNAGIKIGKENGLTCEEHVLTM